MKYRTKHIEITDVPEGTQVEVCVRYGNGGKLDLKLPAPVSISCATVGSPGDVARGVQIETGCSPTGARAVQKFLKAHFGSTREEDH